LILLAHAVLDAGFLRARLPPPALEKLVSLTAKNDGLTGAYNAVFGDIQQIRNRARDTAARLAELLALPPLDRAFSGAEQTLYARSQLTADRHATISAQRDKIIGTSRDEANRAAEQLRRLEADAAALTAQVSAVPQRIVAWLRDVPAHIAITMHDGKIKVPAGEPQSAVAALREKLQSLADEQHSVASAPFDRATVTAVCRRFVQSLAVRGAPDLRPTVTAAREPALPMLAQTLLSGEVIRSVDTAALLAWFGGDHLLEALLAQAEQLLTADDRAGLSADARLKRQAELQVEALEVGRQEESVIESAAQKGIEILRRPNADPRAVLSLAGSLPAPL
jgi:hypothetical protein